MSDIRVIHTRDGSSTLYHAALNETYHSIHGALTESRHVFVRNGFIPARGSGKNLLRILEVGFGTGLNAALTARAAQENKQPVEYVGLEPYPVAPELLARLDYADVLSPEETDLFQTIHAAPWETAVGIHETFRIEKKRTGISEVENAGLFGLIYFDAFAPEKQPGLWTPGVLQKCYTLLEAGGLLVTYCAKGQFKRDLKHCGFQVEARPGPPGKREITLARK